jgi:hypothetical protein
VAGRRRSRVAPAAILPAVSDGGALDSAPDQIAIRTVGQVAAIEPIGPLPQMAREVLGATP